MHEEEILKNRYIVIIGVENPYRDAIRRAATLAKFRVVAAPHEAPLQIEREDVSLVIVGVSILESAAERVGSIRSRFRDSPSVVLVSSDCAGAGAHLKHLGVSEVIELPDRPMIVAERCFQHRDLDDAREIPELIGSSESVRALRRALISCARSRTQVLLTGDTGTGKSLVARVIHRLSDRGGRPMIHVDCASLSPNLIESALFGHERGAFTGASEMREGYFERAEGGTIFLDEIGELDRSLQARFLHVLEDREFERVGGSRLLAMSARVISATNRDLTEEVAEGRFRRDLYYRLRVVHLQIPSLLQRISDIDLLVDAFVRHLANELGRTAPEVSSDFIDRLKSHSWPGNVRELSNVIEAVLARFDTSQLRAQHLDDMLFQESRVAISVPVPEFGAIPDSAVDRSAASGARRILKRHLIETGGNVARVARRMGMSRSTVRYKIRRYGLADLIPKD